jgi:hypothetical protein
MHRAVRTLFLALSLTAVMAVGVQANSGGVAAVPLNNGQETTDAKFGGSGSFTWWVDGGDLCYTLAVKGLTSAPFAAHIHGVAGRTEFAGIVVPLVQPASATGSSTACATPDPSVLAAIVANPRDYYVNVHTTMFTGGEVRGQLK